MPLRHRRPDLEHGVAFWSEALNATEETVSEQSRHISGDGKAGEERMHLDLETDNVEAEVRRLEALGATRWDHQAERGFDFWVLHDPWGNEFCVPAPEFPELLARQEPRNHGSQSG